MKLIMDGKQIEVKKGKTILEAAKENNIYIPNLCSHPELTSYGGCRLCIVEVEGMRGYPTACTTEVKAGMKIKTATKILLDMRKEIIQLMLSDHPTGCLLCEDDEECAKSQATIRKAGATTGCRWCPNDDDCELQDIVKHYSIDEMIFPVYYQGFEVEKNDPFFDRDYNLCIYCGRCVRICQEHRKSHVITLNQRGKNITIGPAYKMSHIEAGCEFCGACISICPTGANFEKNRKWAGKADNYSTGVCTFCGLNCDYQVVKKKDQIIGTIPPGDPHLSGGELCVKGRFCFSELINSPLRLKEPSYKFTEGVGMIGWDEAIKRATEMIKHNDPERTALYLSPTLSLEELYAASHFAGEVLKTKKISSSVMNKNHKTFIDMLKKSCSIDEVEKSDCIISVYLNGNYNYAPITLAIKRAADRGIPYYQIGCFLDTTSRFTTDQLIPPPGKEKSFFKGIINYLQKGQRGTSQVKELINQIKLSPSPCLVIGHHFLDMSEGDELLKYINQIAELTGAKIFVTNPISNLLGLMTIKGLTDNESLLKLCENGKIDLLYIIGDNPFLTRPPVKNIIYQGVFAPVESLRSDLILPSAAFGEISGSIVTLNMNQKKFKKTINPPGKVLTNNQIFTKIARKMGYKNLKYSLKDIHKLIPEKLKTYPLLTDIKVNPKIKVSGVDSAFPYYLLMEKFPHHYQNISINQISRGMHDIYPRDTVMLNSQDAVKLGVKDGDFIRVQTDIGQVEFPVKIRKIIREGFVLLISSNDSIFKSNPCPVYLGRN